MDVLLNKQCWVGVDGIKNEVLRSEREKPAVETNRSTSGCSKNCLILTWQESKVTKVWVATVTRVLVVVSRCRYQIRINHFAILT